MTRLLVAFLLLIPLSAFGQCNAGIAGTDEGAVIDKAIAACPSGCTIQVPSGTYSIATQINVCNPNIKLVGGGPGNTVLVQNFPLPVDLISVAANGFDLSGFTINGNNASNGGNLVHIVQVSQAKIHDNIFTDPRSFTVGTTVNGVRIDGASTAAASFNQIINNQFTIPTIAVTLSTNANSNNIQANQFINCFTAFDFNGDGGNSSGNSFSNNIVTGGEGGNYLESVTGSIITGNQFIDNGAYNSTTSMGTYTLNMRLAGGSQQALTIISNNTFVGAAYGAINITNNSRDAVISNNLFANNATDAIFVQNSAGAVTNLSIQSNIFKDNGVQNPTAGFGAIRVDTSSGVPVGDWVISNNIAYDDQANPSQAYGLLIFGGGSAFDLTILGNDFARSKTAAISFQVPISTSSIGPNRESTAGGWVYRGPTGAVTTAP
jgi:hypothetical protein